MPLPLIPIGLGIAQAGLGLLQGGASSSAAAQQYQDQLAFQKASDKFARWQAGMTAKLQNANNQYAYWQQTFQYNQQLAYTNSLRNFELVKAINQAEVVGRTRAAAGADAALQGQGLSEAIREQATADAMALYQYKVQAAKFGATVAAGDQEGATIDRLINDYARQAGDYQAIQQINETYRGRQYTRQQAALMADYLSKYNSQQFYQQQEYQDPIAPLPPLPTMIMPPGPSMTAGAPSGGLTGALNVGTALMGGVMGGFSAWQGLQKYTGTPVAGSSGGGLSSLAPLAFSLPNLMS
jgi:hypothetical protein